jgi:arsenate reductase
MSDTRIRDAVLFLCVANSARSQMAEALARPLAPEGVDVFSAGSQPAHVHPLARRVLEEAGLETGHLRSKGLDAIPRERIRLVVTLCADEVCPVFPGGGGPEEVRRLHWPHPDPAATGPDEAEALASFREVREALRTRLEALFADPELFPR